MFDLLPLRFKGNAAWSTLLTTFGDIKAKVLFRVYVLLSHDVDWGRAGPGSAHIMARKDRFDENALRNDRLEDLYYNFPGYMEVEEKYDVRSTFFFRTYVKDSVHAPPSYHVEEYSEEIRSLVRGGWEVGLHLDPSSFDDVEKIKAEKLAVEKLTGSPIYGNRVHYTMNSDVLWGNLERASFRYDSSAKFSRDHIVDDDFGFFKKDRLTVFPITIMDALVFANFAKDEPSVMDTVKLVVERCRKLPVDKQIITLLWHDCVLRMKKGRLYPKVLEYLCSQEDVKVKRGIDLLDTVDRGPV